MRKRQFCFLNSLEQRVDHRGSTRHLVAWEKDQCQFYLNNSSKRAFFITSEGRKLVLGVHDWLPGITHKWMAGPAAALSTPLISATLKQMPLTNCGVHSSMHTATFSFCENSESLYREMWRQRGCAKFVPCYSWIEMGENKKGDSTQFVIHQFCKFI